MSIRALLWVIIAPAIAVADEPNPPTEHPKRKEALITEDIVEPSLDGNKLASLFEKFTGQKVKVTPEAATARFRFVEEASKDKPIAFREAAELLRKSAILENFAFIADSKAPQSCELKLVPPPRIGGCVFVEVYSSSNPLPNDDSVVTYVMVLRHVGSKEALEHLESKWDKSRDYASIAAVPNAAAIVITDRVSNIRKLIDLQSKFDQPSSNTKKKPKPGK